MLLARFSSNDNRKVSRKRLCCYVGCSSDQITTREGAISFFSYPIKDTERCSIWITNSGREEFRYLTPRELQTKRLCELHFLPNMFSNEFRTHLIKKAVPIDFKQNSPETIQIDDDDDDDVGNNVEVSDEDESGIVSETSSSNNATCENEQEAHDVLVVEPSAADINANSEGLDVLINNIIKQSYKSSAEKSNSKESANAAETPPSKDSCIEKDISSLVNIITQKSSQPERIITLKLTEKNKSDSNEDVSNSGENYLSKAVKKRKNDTKFHNLPPQTTQSDFYFQQCPTTEDNSYSEAPDGELPLFVQQDSLASLGDERANSVASEPPTKKRKRDKDSDDLADHMRDTLKQLIDITTNLSNNDDEFELFGRSVALQLKKMSLCTALTVQAKIQHLLSEYRINEIKNTAKEKSTANEGETEEIRIETITSLEENKLDSPQLSLNCASDTSENQITEES